MDRVLASACAGGRGACLSHSGEVERPDREGVIRSVRNCMVNHRRARSSRHPVPNLRISPGLTALPVVKDTSDGYDRPIVQQWGRH